MKVIDFAKIPGSKRLSALPIRNIIDIKRHHYLDLLKNPLGKKIFMQADGIAKEAGVSSGPPPERGPNSEGLASLRNYATRTME